MPIQKFHEEHYYRERRPDYVEACRWRNRVVEICNVVSEPEKATRFPHNGAQMQLDRFESCAGEVKI